MNYDQAQKLHHVRVNFRLPVLRSVGEILRAKSAVLKRGAKSPKVSQTPENTGAPERGKSTLLHRNGMFSNGQSYEVTSLSLSVNVDYYSSTLWTAPYSDYQQFLFDTIDRMHKDGNSYIKIAQWLNENNHLTPRGSVFKPNHAWSIHMKKRKSIERFSRTYQPEIQDMDIHII